MAIKERPLTVREIQEQKRKLREAENNKTVITNLSQFQAVPVQIYGKNSKLAVHQITILIPPGKKVSLPEHRLIEGQVNNLRKRGLITFNKSNSSAVTGYKQFLDSSILKKENKSTAKKSTKSKSKSN